MKKFVALIVALMLSACGNESQTRVDQITTNEQGQPKQFDLKGLTVGMSLDEIRSTVGDVQCKQAQARLAEMFGADGNNSPEAGKLPGYDKFKMLFTEESDQICTGSQPQQLGNESALPVVLLKNNRSVYIGYLLNSSGDSVIEGLAYKYGWINSTASQAQQELEKINARIVLFNGYRDQKGNVIFFSKTKDNNEIAIVSPRVFDKLMALSAADIRSRSGVGNL